MSRKCPYCGEHVPSYSLNCPKCYKSIPREEFKIEDDIRSEQIPRDRAPSVQTFDRRIVLVLALIPAAIGLMGMAQMYEREYKKGAIFLIAGLMLFIPMISIIVNLDSFGGGTFFAAMGLVFFIILYIVGYVVQAFDALIRSIFPVSFRL